MQPKIKYFIIVVFVTLILTLVVGTFNVSSIDASAVPSANLAQENQIEFPTGESIFNTIGLSDREKIKDTAATTLSRSKPLESVDVAITNTISGDGTLRAGASNALLRREDFLGVLAAVELRSSTQELIIADDIRRKLIKIGLEIPHSSSVACGARICAFLLTHIKSADVPQLSEKLNPLGFGAIVKDERDGDGNDGEIRVITNTDSNNTSLEL